MTRLFQRMHDQFEAQRKEWREAEKPAPQKPRLVTSKVTIEYSLSSLKEK